ncbi:MAG: hypothetical protein AB7T10_04395 [bacterium]
MCEIKSLEEFLDRYPADEAFEHIKQCRECDSRFSAALNLLYPNLPFESVKVKRFNKNRVLFFKLASLTAGITVAVAAGIFFLSNVKADKANGYSSITYNDCLDIMDSISDDEFIEIINKLQEDL